jgi:signal transduction histidine kinase
MDITFTVDEALEKLQGYYALSNEQLTIFYISLRHSLLSPIAGMRVDVEEVQHKLQERSLEGIIEDITQYCDTVDTILNQIRLRDVKPEALEKYKTSLIILSDTLSKLAEIQGNEAIKRHLASAQSLGRAAIFAGIRLFGKPPETYYLRADLNIFEALHSALLEQQGITLNVTVRREYEFQTAADYLTHVIAPLVYNARDHAFKGREKANITITSAKDDAYVYVRVEDNGNGIPAEYQQRIFDKGFTTRAIQEGHGIGLWAARQYAEQHDAVLELETSTPGKTVFVLKITQKRHLLYARLL